MGVLKKLRKLFSSAIECPDKFAGELMYVANSKRRKINLNATLIVDEDHIAVLVVREKVTDIFATGKHKLTVGAMPITARRIKLSPKGKDKKVKRNFRGEIYFVNLNAFTETFEGIESFVIKDNELGRARVRINGEFKLTIDNAKTFISTCIMQWAYPKADLVKKQIGLWISDEVIKNLKRLNLPLLEFAKNNEYIAERIYPNINKKFLSYGLDIKKVIITETFVPSKLTQSLRDREEEEGGSLLENDYERDIAYIPESRHVYDEDLATEYEELLPQNEDYAKRADNAFDFTAPGEEIASQEYEAVNRTQTLVEERPLPFESRTKFCINCAERLEASASACYNCGAKQEEKRICNNCGVQVNEGEFVCPNCRSIIIG